MHPDSKSSNGPPSCLGFATIRGGARFAEAPRATYGPKSSDYSFDVPICLASDSEGKLHGGVRWVFANRKPGNGTRKNCYSFGPFVGVPFDIMPK